MSRAPGGERRRRIGEAAGRQDDAEDADLERPRCVVERRLGAAEARQPVAKQCGERRGRKVARRGERQPREHARLGFAEWAAGGGFDLDPPARELGGDASRDGDVGGDQRRGAAGRVERFAHRAGERQSLFVLVGGRDDRDAGERAFDCRFAQRLAGVFIASTAPGVGRVGRAQRLAEEACAGGVRGAGFAERTHGVAADADDLQQPVEDRLGVAGDADRVAVGIAEQRPGGGVEVAIEVGQHDRALRRTRNRRHQPCGGAVGAGRAGDDRRSALCPRGERLDLGVDRQRRAARAVDEAALGEPVGPMGEGDLEEVERHAPIGIETVGHQVVQSPGVDALDDEVVDQAGKVAGEREGLGRARRHQRRLGRIEREPPVGADAADRASERLAPGAREPRQRHSPRQFADRRRDLFLSERVVGERIERVAARLEGAERGDARQDEARPAAAGRDERSRQRRRGALGRDVDRRVGERERPAGAGESLDQRTVDERPRQRRRERDAGGNGEEIGLPQEPTRAFSKPGRLSRARAAKASGQASAAEDHQFAVGEVAGRRGLRTLVVTRLALGEITSGEAGNAADGVGDDEEAAVAGEAAAIGGAEAREVARVAAVDEMDAGDELAPDPPRLEDERPRLISGKTDEGIAAKRRVVGEQARIVCRQQRRLLPVRRVVDDAHADLSARQQRREDDLALRIAAIADRRERRQRMGRRRDGEIDDVTPTDRAGMERMAVAAIVWVDAPARHVAAGVAALGGFAGRDDLQQDADDSVVRGEQMPEAWQVADRRPRGEAGETVGPECARPLGKASRQTVDDFREVTLFDHPANDVGRSGIDHKNLPFANFDAARVRRTIVE